MCSAKSAFKKSKPPSQRSSCTGAMFRPKAYSESERRLAALARNVAMHRDVLYHGTRHCRSILTMGVLFPSVDGDKVCFTRSPEEAAYWALLERDHDEGRGAVLIFDRQSLLCRYSIAPCHDPLWDDRESYRDEAEEGIWGEVINVGKHLIGFVSESMVRSTVKLRSLNGVHRVRMEARLNELLYHVQEWRHRPEELIAPAMKELKAHQDRIAKAVGLILE